MLKDEIEYFKIYITIEGSDIESSKKRGDWVRH